MPGVRALWSYLIVPLHSQHQTCINGLPVKPIRSCRHEALVDITGSAARISTESGSSLRTECVQEEIQPLIQLTAAKASPRQTGRRQMTGVSEPSHSRRGSTEGLRAIVDWLHAWPQFGAVGPSADGLCECSEAVLPVQVLCQLSTCTCLVP